MRRYLDDEMQKALNYRVCSVLKIKDDDLITNKSCLNNSIDICKKHNIDIDLFVSTYKKIEKCFYESDQDIKVIHSSKILDHDDFNTFIYYQGDISILEKDLIGVVGSRNYNKYGEENTNKVCLSFKQKDFCIVSGLAYGVDTIAHSNCLENDIKTVMVLANSLGKTYPKENADLYNNLIKKNNLALSLTSFDQRLEKYMFIQRDYLLSSIVNALVVPQAYDNSGTLYSVKKASSLDKPIYVPLNLYQDQNLKWIKDPRYKNISIYDDEKQIINMYKKYYKKENISSEQLSLF